MPMTDVQCKVCGPEADTFNVYAPLEGDAVKYPPCTNCGGETEFLVTKAPATDVLGHEIYDEVLDVTYTSARERDRKMAEANFQPCGDPVGGARRTEMSDWRSRKPTFSYGNQGRRG